MRLIAICKQVADSVETCRVGWMREEEVLRADIQRVRSGE